jgi:hypothetical protein
MIAYHTPIEKETKKGRKEKIMEYIIKKNEGNQMEIYSTIRLCLFVNNSTSPLPTTRLTYSLQNPDSSKADLTSAGLTFDLSPTSHHFLYPIITHFIHILTKSKFHLQPK